MYRDRHPIKYRYRKLRNRAKERGHSFTLTLEKFTQLWDGWLSKNHGKAAWAFSIDRINDDFGYSDDNVQVLTLSENSRKRYVPFFKNQFHQEARDERDIREAEAAVAAVAASMLEAKA